ncbi:MAG TPA: hypothetical protein PK156_43215 [Polyangium sp.]|nr:hypothetical protein [Polyangium sp.]
MHKHHVALTKSYIAKLFGVELKEVNLWIYRFQEYLVPDAGRAQNEERQFFAEDLKVFALVADHWESTPNFEPDYENICANLNCREQHGEKYTRLAYLHTPLFRTDFESISEDQRDIIVVGGMREEHSSASLRIAEAYQTAGNELVERALKLDMAYEFAYPIFFMYRHALECFLKLLVPNKNDSHDLGKLIDAIQFKYNGKFIQWAKDRLMEFHDIDQGSDTFRYADGKHPLPATEYYVNLRQLRVVVTELCTILKNQALAQPSHVT